MSSRGWNSFFACVDSGESRGTMKNMKSIGVATKNSATLETLPFPTDVAGVEPSSFFGTLIDLDVNKKLRGCCSDGATTVNSYTPFSGQKK